MSMHVVVRRMGMALMIVGVMMMPALFIDDIMAQPKKQHKGKMAVAADKQAVRQAIQRTHNVIRHAYKASKEKNTLADNKQLLKRAIQHNKLARRLFATNHFPGAMKHTLRGRQLALQVLSANKVQALSDEALTPEETTQLEGSNMGQMDAVADKEVVQESQMETETLGEIEL